MEHTNHPMLDPDWADLDWDARDARIAVYRAYEEREQLAMLAAHKFREHELAAAKIAAEQYAEEHPIKHAAKETVWTTVAIVYGLLMP